MLCALQQGHLLAARGGRPPHACPLSMHPGLVPLCSCALQLLSEEERHPGGWPTQRAAAGRQEVMHCTRNAQPLPASSCRQGWTLSLKANTLLPPDSLGSAPVTIPHMRFRSSSTWPEAGPAPCARMEPSCPTPLLQQAVSSRPFCCLAPPFAGTASNTQQASHTRCCTAQCCGAHVVLLQHGASGRRLLDGRVDGVELL